MDNDRRLKKAKTSDDQNKKKKNENGVARPFLIPLISCFVILALISCLFTYSYILADFSSQSQKGDIVIEESEQILFVITNGMTTTQIAESLKDMGLISNVTVFKLFSKLDGYDGQYKTGSHYLKKGLEMKDIMKILSSDTVTKKVTFPEGFTVKKIAARLEANDLCSAEEFMNTVNSIVKDEEFLEEYPFLKNLPDRDFALEGYLFPDTYFFDLAATPEEIIRIMLDNFYDRYIPDYYTKAEKLGFTMDEVIILASIVERECRISAERRKVAGVFYNRLTNPFDSSLEYLQSCATLQYIIERDTGFIKDVLTLEDEKIEDRYNTYIHKGLPPGPICSPGIESIKAVLNLEKHDYYFFVLDSKSSSGSHLFAKTLKEHEANKNQQ